MNDQIQQLMSNLPAWAREPAVLIGAGVVLALLLLWLLSLLFRSRPRDEEYVEPVQVEEYPPVVRPISPPPVSPPPPLAEEPPVIVVQEAVPAPEPEPAAAEPVPEPEPMPEPYSPYVAEQAPEPVIADEPIAAAAPFDASPASIAADVPVSDPEPEPVEAPVAASEPAPAPAAPDDLTRMKGVGPRLADRLASVGITRFAQLAALTPEDADALDAKLGDFQGRIHRDRWIEQAGYLASDDIAGFEATFGKL